MRRRGPFRGSSGISGAQSKSASQTNAVSKWRRSSAMELKNLADRIDANDSNLAGSAFTNVSLSGATFRDVNLMGCTVEDANLQDVKINNANLMNMAISDCRLDGFSIDGLLVTDLFAAYYASQQPTGNA
ncbi:MAG: pentapeptide repeat-containing protein [Rhizobiales bacterium]|nr:pentapeptide repeat-containing protein [Hyphomicrobiales bacterium]